MQNYRVSYDRTARLWEVEKLHVGGKMAVPRIRLDARATVIGANLIIKAEVDLQGECLSMSDHRPSKGKVNKKAMLEWCVVYDEAVGAWAIYRQHDPEVLVTTSSLVLECHGITAEGILHCHAQMIMNGKANRDQKGHVSHVLLRTLEVFDQVVDVPLVASMGAKALSPQGVIKQR